MIVSELLPLLEKEDIKTLTQHITDNGYDTPNDLEQLMQKHNIHSTDSNYTLIDVDLIIMFDLRTNYKIFITENEILSKDQLIDKYDFGLLKIEPESIFNNQQIEIVNSDYFIFDKENNKKPVGTLYNTKIYIGKEKWKDFMVTFRFIRSMKLLSNIRSTITNKENEEKKEINYIDKIIGQVLNYE
jgi:hypothetical protein